MRHIDMYKVYVSHMFEEHQYVTQFFHAAPSKKLPESIEEHLEAILDVDSVFRIKIWNDAREVLWSDQGELIGQKYPGNVTLEKALQGKIIYKKTKPQKTEHLFEKERDLFLEIYIPVRGNDTVIGVIELYESDRALSEQINRLVQLVWIIIIAAGFTLYVVLFFIFFRSYRQQKYITEQVRQTEQVTIYALSYQAGLRDEETGNHLKRTTSYVRMIAEELRKQPEYRKYVTPGYIEDLARSAPLHDIGKVGIPDAILRKRGKLTPEEFRYIQSHCQLGARILEEALDDVSIRMTDLHSVRSVRNHRRRA